MAGALELEAQQHRAAGPRAARGPRKWQISCSDGPRDDDPPESCDTGSQHRRSVVFFQPHVRELHTRSRQRGEMRLCVVQASFQFSVPSQEVGISQ